MYTSIHVFLRFSLALLPAGTQLVRCPSGGPGRTVPPLLVGHDGWASAGMGWHRTRAREGMGRGG